MLISWAYGGHYPPYSKLRIMNNIFLTLSILPDTFAICRLEAKAKLPDWVLLANFFSMTRTLDELSIVCPVAQIPPDIECSLEWCCFQVEGQLDFSLTGILASLATPLAQVGISIFALSTYDTDYLMAKQENKELAIEILSQAGHQVKSGARG